MARVEAVVNEIYCDRCPTYLGKEVKVGKKKRKEMERESHGPFSIKIGDQQLVYKELCPRCYGILMRIFEKVAPVKRGRTKIGIAKG